MRKGNIQKNSTLKDYYGKDASPLLFKKLYLFDMDGTIYLGNRLFPGVNELLAKITARGGKTVFITNNASKSVGDYVAKLRRLGLENVTEDNFFTSAQAAVRLMKERHASDTSMEAGAFRARFMANRTRCGDYPAYCLR